MVVAGIQPVELAQDENLLGHRSRNNGNSLKNVMRPARPAAPGPSKNPQIM